MDQNGMDVPGGRVDDRQLIDRVRAGDAAAERALYDTHVNRVYRLAYRMTGDDLLAREFTQDTFVRAFDRLHTFRGEAALSTWLHSVAMSVVVNGMRKIGRHRRHETELEEAEHHAGSPSPRNPGDADPILQEKLDRAIEALSEPQRTVFVLHDVEGFKHEEIAVILRIPVGTSKPRLSRARASLRSDL